MKSIIDSHENYLLAYYGFKDINNFKSRENIARNLLLESSRFYEKDTILQNILFGLKYYY